MMSIKAIIFDLDGTTILSDRNALPTLRTIEAITNAREYVKAACATGRIIQDAKPVIQSLNLTSPCILAGGSQIVDPISFLPIWETFLSKSKIEELVDVIAPYNFFIRGANEPERELASQYVPMTNQPSFFVSRIFMDEILEIVPKLKAIEGINVHYTPSWEPNKYSIQITHVDASKRKALEKWLEIEEVDSSEVMAVGDANNDLPLFEIAGLKIAMGNASDELKTQADWIAPNVEDDGLAIAIEKYILNE